MRNKTKKITLTALLTALAIIIPMFMPIKVIQFYPFTATLASHTPLIIAMFVSPLAAAFAALGSAIGFFFTIDGIVAVRAATHVFFAVAGAMMIRKRMNPVLTILVTMVLHTLADMFTIYLAATFFHMSYLLKGNSMKLVQLWIGVGTSLHHLLDFFIAFVILKPLTKAGLMDSKLIWGGTKRETVSSDQ